MSPVPDALYRFFKGNELTPSAAPDVIVSDLPARRSNIGLAFDGKGGLYVVVVVQVISAPIPMCPRTRSRSASSPVRC